MKRSSGVTGTATRRFVAESTLPYYADVSGAPQNTIIGGASLWVMAGKKKEEYRGVAKFLTFLSQPDVQAEFRKDGLEPAGSSVEQFRSLVSSELAKWEKVIKATGITPN